MELWLQPVKVRYTKAPIRNTRLITKLARLTYSTLKSLVRTVSYYLYWEYEMISESNNSIYSSIIATATSLTKIKYWRHNNRTDPDGFPYHIRFPDPDYTNMPVHMLVRRLSPNLVLTEYTIFFNKQPCLKLREHRDSTSWRKEKHYSEIWITQEPKSKELLFLSIFGPSPFYEF